LSVVHIDRIPDSACPVLAAFVRRLTDELEPASRAAVTPYLPSLAGTARDGHTRERGWMALDWLVRTHCSAWLAHAGDASGADALRGLPAIVDAKTLQRAARAWTTLTEGSDERWDAACAAAGDPSWDAAWPLAWNRSRAVAWDAGFGAAWDAARADAISAGWLTPQSAFDAVRAAVRDAAFAVMSPAAFAAAAQAASTTNGAYAAKYLAAASAAELALAAAAADVRRQLAQGLEASALELLGRMTALGAEAR
jgi:hypothetical protein